MIAIHNGDAVLLTAVEVADTPFARMRGLLGRDGLPQGQGLYLAPCRAIHTFGMRFPIDLIFVDRQWRVSRVVRHVRPWRMAWGGWKAYGVIEIAAETLNGRDLQPGTMLRAQVVPARAGSAAGAGGRP